jgi:DNA mismatch repair protein MutL
MLESQRLLLPETIAVTPEQTALLETYADLLTRLGLEIAPFGPDSVAVQACPSVLRDTDVSQFVRDLLDRLAVRGQQPDVEALLDEMLSMMACKAAVKFGDPLTPEEIDSLIAQRDSVEKSTSCPHGRPTALRFSLADLEKQFKRT